MVQSQVAGRISDGTGYFKPRAPRMVHGLLVGGLEHFFPGESMVNKG